VDGNTIVVIENSELVQAQMPGERDGFLADAFHQIAIGSQHERRVIDDLSAENRGEMALRDGHADGIGESLAEGAGCRFYAWLMAVLGMARRERADLAKALDLLDRHFLVAEEMQERVEQHRAMARGKHETIAIGPRRVDRIEFQKAREKDGGDVSRAHRQTGM